MPRDRISPASSRGGGERAAQTWQNRRLWMILSVRSQNIAGRFGIAAFL